MKPETIAVHSGYEVERTTKTVAVPIYQTVAYAFDSAEHAAALFNLELEGYRYSRIGNPTNAVLERRVAALEGGREACARFPMFSEPDESYHGLIYIDHYGPTAYIERRRSVGQRTSGAVLSPLSAFLLLSGIETLPLRMERHVENAAKVADFLRRDSRVEWNRYAGFEDDPDHDLAQKYLNGRGPSLLTLGLVGGFDAGRAFYDKLKLFKRLVNIGDCKSLACHPASTTHRQMTSAEQDKAGVRSEMIRLSIGIEHIDDIIEDLDQALGVRMTTKRRSKSSISNVVATHSS